MAMVRLAATLLVLTALVGASALAQSDTAVVNAVRLGVEGARTRVVVDSDQPLNHTVFTLAEQGARVVIDLERVEFELGGRAIGGGQRLVDGEGLVAAYRYAGFSPTRSRIVLDLATPAAVVSQFQLPPGPGRARHRLVVDLEATTQERFRATAGFPETLVAPHARSAPAGAETFVVVLDPGHGGVDIGASGPDGTREKVVNLALAEAVRERLEATGRYRVVMTRDRDRSVALEERVRIARGAGADLFLSIHADSDERSRTTRGASVYTLADYAEGRSRSEILREDPWILDVDLSSRGAEVGDILVDLVHRDTKNQSTAFAEALIPHLRATGPLLRNTHRSAGFYVLLAPDVPAVLLEAGFITNPQDEARLTSNTDRGALADAIATGIDEYFDQRERLYAAR
jgi:N-acetylmuramoyl-L-alanine amidase